MFQFYKISVGNDVKKFRLLEIIYNYVYLNKLHVGLHKSHNSMIMLHTHITYIECKGANYMPPLVFLIT